MTVRSERTSNFQTILRRFVGRPGSGKPWTVKTLAETTGITDRTVQGYYGGESEPSWEKMLVIADALGPAFFNALLAPIGMGGVHIIDETEFSANATISSMAAELAQLAKANEDGIIDHRERAELAPRLKDLGVRLIQESAAMEKGRVLRQVGAAE